MDALSARILLSAVGILLFSVGILLSADGILLHIQSKQRTQKRNLTHQGDEPTPVHSL